MRLPVIPRDIRELAERLGTAGRKAYLVGGALRDGMLGRPVDDFDIATDAPPEEVAKLFRRVLPTGIKHGTVTVLLRDRPVEVTTFRIEHGYSDGRRPDRVEFAGDIGEDLSRRDFTINAMALDLLRGGLVDPFGGRADIERRLIKAVGDPAARFAEDGLRPLRAIRFACKLDFAIDGDTLAAIPGALGRFVSVSAERVRDEFSKILESRQPSVGLRLMESTGMLALVVPELAACRGVWQKGAHVFDVLDHLYSSADWAPADLTLRLAALFHDIGKPAAKRENEGGEPTFHRHEEISASVAETVLKRMKYPNDTVSRVAHLVRHHMFNYEENWTDAAVRRFIARAGAESVDELLALRIADGSGIRGVQVDPRTLSPFRKRIDEVLEKGQALGIADLAIGGNELAAIGIPRGPALGAILRELLETVLDDPEQNNAESLLLIASRLKERRGL